MTEAKPNPKISPFILLTAATALLIPLLGGQIYTTVTSLKAGFVPAMASVLDGPDLPALSHAILFLPLVIAVIWRLSGTKVVSFPRYGLSFLMTLFAGLLLLSVAESRFLGQSFAQFLEFISYIVAFVAGFSCLGRSLGPRIALYSFTAGAGIEAIIGIREWEASRAIDPTWRIFANWSNPNALAGIMLLGAFAALAVTFDRQKLARVGGVVCFGVTTFALFLTQSRGGTLALVVGLFVGAIVLASKARKTVSKADALAVGCALALAAIFIFGAVQGTRKEGGSTVGQRLTSASASGQQSVQFRMNLWKSSLQIMKDHPGGVGIGAFGNYSAQPGLVSETKLAHDNLLQLGAEASIATPICLILIFMAWLAACLRGKWEIRERSIPLVFTIAALSALCVDGIFESNLYFFGTGLAAFLLMGIGLQLAPDGCSPEISPPHFRFGVILAAAASWIGFGWFGATQWYLARLHDSVGIGAYSDAADYAKSAASLNFLNSESRYILGMLSQNPTDSISELQSACRLEPSSKNLRSLANRYAAAGQPANADVAFNQALEVAPNDLITLRDQLRFEIASFELAKAHLIALKMVAIESEPIFKVRALSELVPLETVEARLFLVREAASPITQADLLSGAVAIEVTYAQQTIPALTDYFKKYGTLNWGPETGDKALKKLNDAMAHASQLLSLEQKLNNPAGVSQAKSDLQLFSNTADNLKSLTANGSGS